jgi:hypothetical protein
VWANLSSQAIMTRMLPLDGKLKTLEISFLGEVQTTLLLGMGHNWKSVDS